VLDAVNCVQRRSKSVFEGDKEGVGPFLIGKFVIKKNYSILQKKNKDGKS